MSGSESEAGPAAGSRGNNLRLKKANPQLVTTKKPSPSPTRRQSQPAPPVTSAAPMPVPVAVRRASTSANGNNGMNGRPQNVYPSPSGDPASASSSNLGGSPRHLRSTSVQPRSSTDLDLSPSSEFPSKPFRAQQKSDFTPLTPVSRIQMGGGGAPDRPLDRPTLVRPGRTSLQHDHPATNNLTNNGGNYLANAAAAHRMSQPDLTMLGSANRYVHICLVLRSDT